MPEQVTEEQLARYVAGDCSQEECQAIEAFLGQSPEAREWVDRARADAAWLDGVQKAAGRNRPDPDATQDAIRATAPVPGEQVRTPASPSHIPQVDGYEIVRELSRGGQGVVYQAIQQSTRRKVAIKVLLEGPYASKSASRRFEREIELIAQLKHPNIISIFHSGTTADERQFYVMDYVRGTPLQRYVRERKLTLEATLKLFATVCDAVQYAHQKGIIHRDLKPTNILVEADGTPKVMDFGLAKLLAGPVETLVSISQEMVGTLPYMSPEQARGNPDEVDTRTDIYALGVILYELLTGHYPYPVVGQIMEVLKHITETPATPPSKRWTSDSGVTRRNSSKLRLGQCPIDDEVQTLVLKALSKERGRRYQSAGELARDIDHYLAGEPIEAKRDSGWYIVRKQLRRYRVPVAIAVAFAAVIIIGLVTSMAFWVRAEAAGRIAFKERDRARQAEELAENEAARVEAANRLLMETIATVNPERPPGMSGGPVAALEAVAARLDQGSLDLDARTEATMRRVLWESYWTYGQYADAEQHIRRALSLYDARDPAEQRKALDALHWLATSLAWQGRIPQAVASFRELLEKDEASWGSEHPDTVQARYTLATLENDAKAVSEAIAEYQHIVAKNRQGKGDDDENLGLHLFRLGRMLGESGDYVNAVAVARELVELDRAQCGDEHVYVAQALSLLGTALEASGALEGALQAFKDAYDVRRHVLPGVVPAMAASIADIGRVLMKQGRFREAEDQLREALGILTKSAPGFWVTFDTMSALGGALVGQGRYEEAEPLLLESYRQLSGNPFVWQSKKHEALERIVTLYEESGEQDELTKWRTQLLRVRHIAP